MMLLPGTFSGWVTVLFSDDDYIANEAMFDWFNDTATSTNPPYQGKVCCACAVGSVNDV